MDYICSKKYGQMKYEKHQNYKLEGNKSNNQTSLLSSRHDKNIFF